MQKLIFVSLVTALFAQSPSTPQAAVDELLAADRAFAAAALHKNVVSAIAAMLADDVAMPAPAGEMARGKARVIQLLESNPDNVKGHATWAPVRGGLAADGQHGFTVGYMTVTRPDNSTVPWKYVAYWVRQREGWRIVVYKRARAEAPPPSREMMPPALPARLVPPSTDQEAIAKYKASLDRAERAFSDEAQKIGLGPAFAKHGSPDAVNVGPPTSPTFVVSAAEIGKSIGASSPEPTSPLAWAPDDVIVASSGDLGVTFGMIRPHAPPPAGQPSAFPFITIWRRATPNDPWRYIAE